MRAQALENAQRPADAAAVYRTLAARFPRREFAGAALWRLGWTSFLKGDPRAASQQWSRLLDTGNRAYRLAALYWRGRAVDEARGRPQIVQLALTVALEHFTAIMAHSLLTERQPLPGASEEILRLWQWHAIEEIEHKAVAYDTFLAVTRHMSGLRRWALRCQVMALVSLQFWYSNFQRMADFFRQDGMNTPRTWWRVAKYLLVKPGMMRRIFRDYLRFYGPGFHPWHRDDRKLIREIESKLTLTTPAAAA